MYRSTYHLYNIQIRVFLPGIILEHLDTLDDDSVGRYVAISHLFHNIVSQAGRT